MSGCNGEKVMLFFEWRKQQKDGRDEDFYHEQYRKYYFKAIKACRERQRKAKRGN